MYIIIIIIRLATMAATTLNISSKYSLHTYQRIKHACYAIWTNPESVSHGHQAATRSPPHHKGAAR